MSINKLMYKQTMEYTYNGISFSHKCYNIDEPQKHAEENNPGTKFMYCMIQFI